MTDKINEFMKKCTSSEEVLKRISFYLLLSCILLCLIFFKLYQINENILLLTENSTNLIIPNEKNDEYESVKDIFIEEETKPGDVVPLYDEYKNSTTETMTDNNSETSTYDNKNENTTYSTTTSTSQENNSTKSDYIINVNSKKIHYADCSFVLRMKEQNKKAIKLSNIELNEYLNNGYTLCSTCGG